MRAVGLMALLVAGCSGVAGQEAGLRAGTPVPFAAMSTSSSSTTTTSTTSTVPAAVAGDIQAAADTPAPGPATAPSPSPRTVHQQAWTPFASAGGVTLRHPSSRVELIGFHESNLDGARQLEPLAGSAPTVTLEARGRDTGSRSAADVVLDPATEIRSPVTGTVRHAGSYILYCNQTDNFLVVEPDDHPGWEVKILHIEGLLVGVGARVAAGQTPISPNARKLPFQSQVDKVTAQPAWPHVHIEIDDPNIPDRPTPGGGC
ncbi:MAG: M23 family metallopeptidase [Actinobacteria bacterium]|nr:M23 family metallopeptidase [Actinomycetota bacterium]